MKEIINDIINSMEDLADPKRITMAKKSYPTKMTILGLTVPNLRIILKELKTQTIQFSRQDRLKLIKGLDKTNIIECQQLAFLYIEKDKDVLNSLTEKDIDELGTRMDNWISVDHYGALVVGYAWREGIIPIEKVKSYINSEDVWQRRIPVVATVSLNQKARGGKGDSKQTLEICELVIDDHEDMIVKALSWALRECAKIDREPVEVFIAKHKDKLHKKVLREVENKLNKGTKN